MPLLQHERYELLGELGTGGMATVYLGRLKGAHGFSRLVAVKCLHPQFAKDKEFSAMVLDEARIGARIRHPNVVATLDVAVAPGQLLNVMEYVEGDALSSLGHTARSRNERIPVAIACAIMHDVLCGLHAAHEARDEAGQPLSIVHRDVSPHNVLIGVDGLARLLDFGIAKARGQQHHTTTGEVKGKIGYMPIEQLCGETIDRRTDIYAAGVILWELLTGERLFSGAFEKQLNDQVNGSTPPIAPSKKTGGGLSAELDALTLRAIASDAKKRFPTALAMANALAAATTLAPRLEVARWMRGLAQERLDARARMIEEASSTTTAPAIELPSGITMTTTVVDPSPFSLGAKAQRRSSILVTLGVAIALLSTFALGSARLRPVAGGTVVTSVERVAEPAFVVPQAEAPRPVAPTTAAMPEPAPPPARREVVHSRARAVRATAPGMSKDCRLPYTVDASGQRHFKLECL